VPGEEWFYEHVHFTFPGNYQLARMVADAVAGALPATITGTARSDAPWASEADCARRLGYAAGQEHDVLQRVLSRLDEPIYRRQLNDAARRERFVRRREALRGETKPTARRRTVDEIRAALVRAPEDWRLHELLARALTAADLPDAALTAWQEVAARVPHSATPAFEAAQILVEQGKPAEAQARFERALAVNPDFAKAHEGLGLLHVRQNRPDLALRHLRDALRLDPTRTEAAQALARLTGR
jgi:tetratricopeptide (TPR) repeat protein